MVASVESGGGDLRSAREASAWVVALCGATHDTRHTTNQQAHGLARGMRRSIVGLSTAPGAQRSGSARAASSSPAALLSPRQADFLMLFFVLSPLS
jgi:hypothetical protein